MKVFHCEFLSSFYFDLSYSLGLVKYLTDGRCSKLSVEWMKSAVALWNQHTWSLTQWVQTVNLSAFDDSPKTSATTALLLTLIPGLLGEKGLAWLQRNPSFLYLSPYPPYPLGFCFSLSSKISLRKNTVWYIPWSAHQEVHSATEPITWWGLGFEQGSRGAEGAKEKDLWHHQCPGRHPPH